MQKSLRRKDFFLIKILPLQQKHYYMMKKIIRTIYIFLVFCFLTSLVSCGHGGKNSAEEAADSFSVAYFNWRFADALPFVTQDSRRWLSFAASQVSQEDVDSLRAMLNGAEVKTKDVDYKNDTTAVATIIVNNFLSFDSIGRQPSVVAEKKFLLPLVLREDKWQVHLSTLP